MKYGLIQKKSYKNYILPFEPLKELDEEIGENQENEEIVEN